MNFDYLIVGAGFAGSVCARCLAEEGNKILIIDKREHLGGNAYDKFDDNGVLIHPYGPHIFHTNSRKVFSFLSRFTDWRFYEHKVLANTNGNLYSIPINRMTINKVFNLNLKEEDVENFLDSKREKISEIKTSEDVVLSSVGKELCELFFRGYTKKQWDLDLSELSAGVAARIPTRTNDDDRYFSDTFQFMPLLGYTKLFENMLNHENIESRTGVDFFQENLQEKSRKIIFTGPIDKYFDYCFGKLPYRSLEFVHEFIDEDEKYQDVGTVNYPNHEAFTRITEFKHLTGQKVNGTSIVKEYPQSSGDPYYPIPNKNNEDLYQKYLNKAEEQDNVFFVGRLAQYRYYNMDQVVASALKLSEDLLNKNE